MYAKHIAIYTLASLLSGHLIAQHLTTGEDALLKDTATTAHRTTLGGYGNVRYIRDFNIEHSVINLDRFVLFAGHKFSKRISFLSELEIEDAKISGGEAGGEVALEQCYLKFNVSPSNYFIAGLFIPRMGIINENHLPNTYFGNERPQVETFIIPSTWRELGVSFYGSLSSLPVHYSLGIVNGLNSEGFEHGNVIREGRFEGGDATANNLAVTGSVQLHKNNLRAQVSGYYGGSVGLAPRQADSLKLASGMFGTPVIVGAGDVQYETQGISVKLLAALVSIPNASDINRAYASNTPELAYGAYAEVAYNILNTCKKFEGRQLNVFARYETLDMNSEIPENGITDGTLKQQHIVAGISYLPIHNVIIKADIRVMHTGEENPDLVINPNPAAPAYEQNNTFLNLGIGYSF